MKTQVAILMLGTAAVAQAGAYDARRQEMNNWVDAAPFDDSARRSSVKSAMGSYLSEIDTALDTLSRALEPGGSDYASKWSGALGRAKDAFVSFQSALHSAAGSETNEKVKSDLLRIATEEQGFINSLAGTENVGKGADALVKVRKDLEDTRSDVVLKKFSQFITDASERNRYAAQAFSRMRTGTEDGKRSMALAKASSRDAIMAGVAAIRDFLGQKLDQFTLVKSDFKTWDGLINDLRRTHNESIVIIARAMCEGEEWEAEALGQTAADGIRAQINPLYQKLKQSGEGLKTRLANLHSTTHQSEAANLLTDINSKLNSIERTAQTGLLSGSVSPNIRTKAAYGTAQHNSMASTYSCAASNLALPGCSRPKGTKVTKGCFVDCIRVSGNACQVVEFKPKGTRAEQLGHEQARTYHNDILAKFSSASPSSTSDSFFSGEFAVFKQCFDASSKTLNLSRYEVITYDFCPINEATIADILQ